MIQTVKNFFSSSNFLPHGHCILWQPDILWLHVISDAGIAAAYFSIPFVLLYFIWKRRCMSSELLESMRKDKDMKNISVIMCTSSAYSKDKERSESLGVIGYMVKPPVFEGMKPMLERIPALQLSQAGEGYLLQRAS